MKPIKFSELTALDSRDYRSLEKDMIKDPSVAKNLFLNLSSKFAIDQIEDALSSLDEIPLFHIISNQEGIAHIDEPNNDYNQFEGKFTFETSPIRATSKTKNFKIDVPFGKLSQSEIKQGSVIKIEFNQSIHEISISKNGKTIFDSLTTDKQKGPVVFNLQAGEYLLHVDHAPVRLKVTDQK